MTYSPIIIRNDIETRANSSFAQDVHRGGIPSIETLIYQNGRLVPYLVLNFNDLSRGYSRNMAGTRNDDYFQAFNVIAVAPTDIIAEELQIKAVDVFLGYSPPYSGEINKRPGGGIFTILNSTGAVEAYISVTSFICTVQLLEAV